MIKDIIKKQIRKTGMVRALEKDNEKLENQIKNLKKNNNLEKENLKVVEDKLRILGFKDQLRKKYKNLNPHKLDLINLTFQKIIPNAISFADLGGTWRVNGGYTFYTIDKYNIKSAFLVDTNINNLILSKTNEYKNLTLVNDNFGENTAIDQLGELDAIFLFDVLLHQVKPDWDEVLKRYSSICNCMVIFNPQFTNSENTLRLTDLGNEEYLENTPYDKDHPTYKSFLEKKNEITHYDPNRTIKDSHVLWQWGIVDKDLYAKMEDLGFSLQFYQNLGNFPNLNNFENHAFIFKKH